MTERVVMTGLGALSSAGRDLAHARPNFVSGACCLSPINDPRLAHLKARYAGLIRDVPPSGDASDRGAQWDRHVQLALAAAREALDSAALKPAALGRRMGLVFATCSGPMLRIEEHYERILHGDGRITAAELWAKQYYAGAHVLAEALHIGGLVQTVVTACTAGTAAIALAADLVRCGVLDAALAGGADAFSPSTLAGFDGLKATAEGRCAPFSKPFGLNLGEGAGFVVLESFVHAEARGATLRAEVLGHGMSNDAYHCSAPDPGGRGLAAAMTQALRDAGLTPGQIEYINAHGTGTEANDKAETRAIRKVFGPLTERIPVSSTKSQVGHCLGAAGVLETIAALVCAEAGVFPATANFSEPREGCALDHVTASGRPWRGTRTWLTNNAAFGGHNACLALAVSGPRLVPASAASAASRTTSREPIVITGCGLISVLGGVMGATATGFGEGRTGLSPCPWPGLESLTAGFVDDELVAAVDRRLDLRSLDRSSRWATAATRLALRDAGLARQPAVLAQLGLYLLLSAGPSWAESEFLTAFLRNDRQVTQVMAFPYIVPSSVAGNVCRCLRLTGHNLTLSAGPGGGLLGFGPALAALRNGHAPALLCGAVDELTERLVADRFHAGHFEPPGRPPGEGAAVFCLETAAHAAGRNAKPLATIAGASFSNDASTSPGVKPGLEGLEWAIRDALEQARLNAADVGVVCGSAAPRDGVAGVLGRIAPGWAGAWVDTAGSTGLMESAQPLFDLAATLGKARSSGARPILAVVSSPHGLHGAVIVES